MSNQHQHEYALPAPEPQPTELTQEHPAAGSEAMRTDISDQALFTHSYTPEHVQPLATNSDGSLIRQPFVNPNNPGPDRDAERSFNLRMSGRARAGVVGTLLVASIAVTGMSEGGFKIGSLFAHHDNQPSATRYIDGYSVPPTGPITITMPSAEAPAVAAAPPEQAHATIPHHDHAVANTTPRRSTEQTPEKTDTKVVVVNKTKTDPTKVDKTETTDTGTKTDTTKKPETTETGTKTDPTKTETTDTGTKTETTETTDPTKTDKTTEKTDSTPVVQIDKTSTTPN